MQFLNQFFFDIYPYLAGAVFLIGSWLRYDYGQYSWRAGSSQMLDKKGMRLASNLFHIGIIGIFAGHFLGMLTPHWMYEAFLPIDVKQKLAMIAGGACGLMTLIGGALLLKRRLTNPRVRATSSFADIMILTLLVVQVCLGLLTIQVLRPAYGRQRNDEAGGLGAGGGDVPRRCLYAPGRGGDYLQAAHGAGHDAVRAVPVLPPGAYLECAGRVSDPPLPAGAQPPLSLTPPPPPIASGGAIPIIPLPSAYSRRLVVN